MTSLVCLDSAPADNGDVDWRAVRQHGSLTLFESTRPQDVVARAKDATVVLTNKVRLDRAALEQLPVLTLICVLATGFDVVDVDAAVERGITVCNVPGYSTAAAAQTSIALLLELTHGAGLHSAAVHAGEWSRQPTFAYWRQPLVELDGKVMSIVGYGAIGQRVGAIAEALGMTVIPTVVPGREDTPGRTPLREALAQADVVSLHCPLTPATTHLIDGVALAAMKRGAFLINAGRGPLVDDLAVRAALESGWLAGFAADVLSAEPPPLNHPLMGAPRAILTPHIGWAAQEARQRLIDLTADSIGSYLAGTPVRVVASPT